MASAFVAGKMASEPEVAEEEAGRSLQDLHKRVHFSASLRFRLHQVAGLDMYGVVAERLEFAVFRSPFTLWANVAQLVEQRFRKARVVSSILTVGSISYRLGGKNLRKQGARVSVGSSVKWWHRHSRRRIPQDTRTAL